MWWTGLRVWIFYNLFMTKVLAPVVAIGFVVSIEWIMWKADPGGESFLHVGQWGVLVSALLIFLVVMDPLAVNWVSETRIARACAQTVMKRAPWLRGHLARKRFQDGVSLVGQRRRSI